MTTMLTSLLRDDTDPKQALRLAANDQRFPAPLPQMRAEPGAPGYRVAPVGEAWQQASADALVRRRFAWRGYNTDALDYRSTAANRLTLAAWLGDELTATLTLVRDSVDGLQTETLYAHELARLRRPGRMLCEVARLAVDPDYSCPRLLRALFAGAFEHGRDCFAASDVVIGVNPRHATYYQRRMGFRQIGARRHYPRVDAPVVLLHQTLVEMRSAAVFRS